MIQLTENLLTGTKMNDSKIVASALCVIAFATFCSIITIIQLHNEISNFYDESIEELSIFKVFITKIHCEHKWAVSK